MTTRKQIWDKLDELEGKKKGSSYKNLMKEIKLGVLKTKVKKKKNIWDEIWMPYQTKEEKEKIAGENRRRWDARFGDD